MTTYRRATRMTPNIPVSSDDEKVDEETTLSTPLITPSGLQPNGETTVIISKHESAFQIAVQVFIPFLVAGFGTVGAGMVLDVVQHWAVFEEVKELFILVPPLLGLKGNLEMTLASRLSTQANLGKIDTKAQKIKMIYGNLVLIQAQALVVGLLAALFAMVMGWIPSGEWNVEHGFILCASSMLTASFASLVLGLIMIGVVLVSRHIGVNPDNVATPVAASLGDLTTLTLLAAVGQLVNYIVSLKQMWLPPTLMGVLISLIPLFIYLAINNEYVCEVVYTGWTPVICAMAISSVGGLVLDKTVTDEKYKGMAVFSPVMNGVGGNLVAVQASRLSTGLHQRSSLGKLPPDTPYVCANPLKTFYFKNTNGKTALVLLLMAVPGHIIFIYAIYFMKAGHTTITAPFLLVYCSAAVIQVVILLYVCNVLVHLMWERGNDPDNFAIPYLTALGDLLGTSLLALSFYILFTIGDQDSDVGD